MNDINTYLALQEKERLYSVGLSLFQKYRGASTYPKHYDKIKSGPFGSNTELLHDLLTKIADQGTPIIQQPVAATPITTIEVITEEKQTHRDALIRQVSNELREAYKIRNKLSDRFHDLHTDEQRADNSDKIVAQDDEIKAVLKKLEYLKIHGKLPPVEEEEVFVLPSTDAELSILQNRKQSHRLKIEKQVELLHSYKEKDKRRKKLPKKQELLDELNVQIEQIKKKRKWLREKK